MSEPTRRSALGALAGAAGVLATAGRSGRAHAAPPMEARPVAIRAVPIDRFSLRNPDLVRFGSLDFLGGIELSCPDERFGGWSALAVSPDGSRLTSVSDKGTWLTATLVTRGDAPLGLTDAMLAPVIGPDGRPVAGTRRWDCESLAIQDGTTWIGLERVNEVLRFSIGKDGLAARGVPIPVPPDVKRFSANRGLEALALVPSGPYAGSLIGVGERPFDGRDGPVSPGFFITGPSGGFEIVRRDGFDITDAAFLPSGDLLLLERRFAWLSGIAMRIRRFDGRALRPGARLDGDTLVSADMAMHIDNMEGLCVHRAADGGTILTLISDDNFNVLQRTLLLRFRLAGA
ncbi:esterase-like activity of phytase family protein [uncultured Alsobacter sp.]|uniref:esterase-like activity of phytase family protein n=1 Tax=uncultured Alsobacter sp. TaxID=1748258 RepID=UPI0025E203D3|nr:esterase-like activity of phytase family protein [uncultured Alsobacter sp.]